MSKARSGTIGSCLHGAGWLAASCAALAQPAGVALPVSALGFYLALAAAALLLLGVALLLWRQAGLLRRVEAAKEEQARAHSQLRSVIEAATQVAIVATDLSGRIVTFNRGAERMLGYSAAEVIGIHTPELLHLPEEMAARSRELSAELGYPVAACDVFIAGVASDRPADGIWTYVRKDGTHLAVNLIVTAVHDAAGALAGFLGVAIDVSEPRRAEAARREAERQTATARAQLEAFIEYAPVAVAMLDLELRFIGYSQRWLSDYRLQGGQLLGSTPLTLFPAAAADWAGTFERCLRGHIERCDDYCFIGADGVRQWLRWEVRPWRDARGRIGGIVMFTEDVSARKRAAEMLEARDQLLKKLSDRVPGMIYQFRLYPDGRADFPYSSEGIRDLYELEPADVADDAVPLMERIHPDDRGRVAEAMHTSAASGTLCNEAYRVCLPVRGLRWLRGEGVAEWQADGSVLWHGYTTDITERKQGLEQLQALNNRLALATQAGGIGVWEWDLSRDEILWDARMYEIYQIEPEPPLSSSRLPTQLIHPDDLPRVAGEYAQALAGAKQYTVEYRIVWPDGQERIITSAGVVSRDERGIATRITGVTWDITERKRVERLKSEFVSTVSHELRTPLTSIRGTLGLVLGGVVGAVPEQAAELLRIAYKNSEQLSLLINDILDIEKIESGRMHFELVRQPLLPLLRNAIEANTGYAHTYGVRLELIQAPMHAEVAVDAPRLLQVMTNLLSNAVKFSPPQGRVTVAVLARPAGFRIEVRDQGSGIPLDFQARIFQKFSQADASDTRAKGGTGLGLSIAKAIVERMGGTIGFESQPGRGATFYVELPDSGAVLHTVNAGI